MDDADVGGLFELQPRSGLIVRVAPRTLQAGRVYGMTLKTVTPADVGRSGPGAVQFSTAPE